MCIYPIFTNKGVISNMPTEFFLALAFYLQCDATAAIQVLDRSEVEPCMAAYTTVKMEFVDGVDALSFKDLSAQERADANHAGYLGYVAWMEANPSLVKEMREEARLEAEAKSGI